MDYNKRKEFLTKLADLLDEYNADIEFSCSESSDTSGLYNDRIIISERRTDLLILDTFEEWFLSSNVIRENM